MVTFVKVPVASEWQICTAIMLLQFYDRFSVDEAD